jgi:tetratricopeptide (TPR) repeat protein
MIALLSWLHARMPAGDHRLVIALLPVEISDRNGYGALGEALLRGTFAPGVRLVLRDDVGAPGFAPLAHEWPDARVLAHRVAIDPGDLVDAVAGLARDPQRAPRDRMLALLQLAFLDLGHGRTAVARQKFTAVAGFFGRSGEPGLQAFAMGGAADVTSREGDPDGARVQYDAALVLAAQAGALPVVLNHALALGGLCRARRQFADAEAYYHLASLTAEKTVNPFARADALEQVGALQLAQRRPAEAAASWSTAAVICRDAEYVERLRSVLTALRDLHMAERQYDEVRICTDELATIDTKGVR